ncbi:unnamed protein product, partial [Heterotrigona itama]
WLVPALALSNAIRSVADEDEGSEEENEENGRQKRLRKETRLAELSESKWGLVARKTMYYVYGINGIESSSSLGPSEPIGRANGPAIEHIAMVT